MNNTLPPHDQRGTTPAKTPAFEDITRRALSGTPPTTVDDFPDDARLALLEARVRDLEAARPPAIPAAEAPPTVPVVVHHDSTGLNYNFKLKPELLYGIATACAVVVLESLIDVANVKDWKAWLLAVVAGCARAVIALIQPRAPAELTVPMDSLPAGTPVKMAE